MYQIFMAHRASYKEREILTKKGDDALQEYQGQVSAVEKFFKQRGTMNVKTLKYDT